MMHICVLIFSHTKGLANDIAAESEQQQDTGLTADEFMSTRAGDTAAERDADARRRRGTPGKEFL